MKSSAILAFAGIFTIGGAASAQKADTDGDGRLSLAEFQASRSAAILARDSDGDGRLSAAEWAVRARNSTAKAQRRDPTKAFARFDGNRDGFLDRGEIGGFLVRRFARADANGDGALTLDERGRGRNAANAKE